MVAFTQLADPFFFLPSFSRVVPLERCWEGGLPLPKGGCGGTCVPSQRPQSHPVLSGMRKGCSALHPPGLVPFSFVTRDGALFSFLRVVYSTPKSAVNKIHPVCWVGMLLKEKKKMRSLHFIPKLTFEETKHLHWKTRNGLIIDSIFCQKEAENY